jgi:hypothetical protein
MIQVFVQKKKKTPAIVYHIYCTVYTFPQYVEFSFRRTLCLYKKKPSRLRKVSLALKRIGREKDNIKGYKSCLKSYCPLLCYIHTAFEKFWGDGIAQLWPIVVQHGSQGIISQRFSLHCACQKVINCCSCPR